jgi:hypothetical protein
MPVPGNNLLPERAKNTRPNPNPAQYMFIDGFWRVPKDF